MTTKQINNLMKFLKKFEDAVNKYNKEKKSGEREKNKKKNGKVKLK